MLQTVKTHLKQLVSFASVSAKSNRDIAEYCVRVLQDSGFACHTIPDPCQDKINVLAMAGNIQKSGIMFSAHMDVVPVKGQDWSYPPFELTDVGDKWYGRGTTDMKGYIALLLTHADTLAKTAHATHTPVYICLSYDEEIGCQGIPHMIAKFPKLIPVAPAYCFVGEPTEMKPVLGHKGKMGVKVIVMGKSCHSACCMDGINAIHIASRIITYIENLMHDCIKNGVQDPLSIPPYATLQTGMIQGGTALNIVPDQATLSFEIRSSYQSEIDALYDKITYYVTDLEHTYGTQIAMDVISAYPPLSTDTNAPIKQISDTLCAHPNTPTTKVSFGTEGGLFHAYGIPTIILGVGNMAQGHIPDEYIAVSQIQQGIHFFDNTITWMKTAHISENL